MQGRFNTFFQLTQSNEVISLMSISMHFECDSKSFEHLKLAMASLCDSTQKSINDVEIKGGLYDNE